MSRDGGGPRWVVVVARNQPGLLEHLRRAFASDDKVRIIVDPKADLSEHPPKIARRLRRQGAVILREDEPAARAFRS